MDPPDGPNRQRESESLRTGNEYLAEKLRPVERVVMSTPVPVPFLAREMLMDTGDSNAVDITQDVSDIIESSASSGNSRVAASTSFVSTGFRGNGAGNSFMSSSVIASESYDENLPSANRIRRLPIFHSISSIAADQSNTGSTFNSPEASPVSESDPERRNGPDVPVVRVHLNSVTAGGLNGSDGDKSASAGANSYDDSKSRTDSSNSLEDGRDELVSPPRLRRPAKTSVKRPLALSNPTSSGTIANDSGSSKSVNAASASVGNVVNNEKCKKKLSPPKEFVIPRRDFLMEVGRAFASLGYQDFTIQAGAIDTLQEFTEMVMFPELFDDLILASLHAKRVTIMPSDVELVKLLVQKRV